MQIFKKSIRSWQLALLAAVYMVSFDNTAFWRGLFELDGKTEAVNALFLASVFIAMVGTTTIIISLSAFKYVFKPLLILLLLSAALADYYMSEYGILIDKDMVRNMFLTDRAEVMELLFSPAMLWHVFLLGGIPSYFVWQLQLQDNSLLANLLGRSLLVIASLAVVALVGFLQYKNFVIVYRENQDMICRINPTCPLVSVTKHVVRMYKPKVELQQLALDAVQQSSPTSRKRQVVILVVGETARAANFSLNGYARNTNPEVGARTDIFNFTNVYSCGTSTAASLPCMFSHITRAKIDEMDPLAVENVMDVLVRAGVSVHWWDNDAGCKGVCVRLPTKDLYFATDPVLCVEDNCYDEILLAGLDDLIRNDSKDMLVVLHQKGSHGPAYYRRYPAAFKQFQPECTIVEVQDCSQEQIVNSYDNTILYTDHVLSLLIQMLESHANDFNTALVYLSDHGESLGERGLYLHGLPFLMAPNEQIHVPMFFWFSPGYREALQINAKCLQDLSSNEFSHDNLFDTLLGLFYVQTSEYKQENNMLSACVQG